MFSSWPGGSSRDSGKVGGLTRIYFAGEGTMLPDGFKNRLRAFARRVAAAITGFLPHRFTEQVRHAYAEASSETIRGRLLSGLLELLRHGGIPRDIHCFELIDKPGIKFVNGDSLALQRLYWFGERGHEPALIEWWRSSCAKATQILELGGNVGSFTVQGGLAAPTVTYTVVEPHPHSAQLLRMNLDVNRLSHVKVIEAAAVGGEGYGDVELWVPVDDHFGAPGGAFLPVGSEIARLPRSSLHVPAIDVRTLIPGVDLIKLDVEGFEYELLSCIYDYLLGRKPTIFVEVLSQARRLQAFISELCLGPYRCFVPVDSGMVELDPAEIGLETIEKLGSRDVVLTTGGHDF
jgi:FkbM family methyltransferase